MSYGIKRYGLTFRCVEPGSHWSAENGLALKWRDSTRSWWLHRPGDPAGADTDCNQLKAAVGAVGRWAQRPRPPVYGRPER